MAGIRTATEEEKTKWRAENPYFEDIDVIDGTPYRKNSDLGEWGKANTAAYRANPYNERNYVNTTNGEWGKAQTAAYRANPYNERNYADTANGELGKAQTAAYRANPYNERNYVDTANGKNNGYTATPTSTSSSNLKVNEENINSFINQIDTSIDMLNSTWNNLVMTDVQKINDSWASNDAKTYVDKLMAEGDKISNIVQALKLLEETYKKVINESTATSQDVSSSVGKL